MRPRGSQIRDEPNCPTPTSPHDLRVGQRDWISDLTAGVTPTRAATGVALVPGVPLAARIALASLGAVVAGVVLATLAPLSALAALIVALAGLVPLVRATGLGAAGDGHNAPCPELAFVFRYPALGGLTAPHRAELLLRGLCLRRQTLPVECCRRLLGTGGA